MYSYIIIPISELSISISEFFMNKETMTEIQTFLAANMKLLRKELCLSQARLAESVGTAPNYISQIEQGNKFPSPVMLENIARALQVHSYELFQPEISNTNPLIHIENDLFGEISLTIERHLRRYRKLIEQS